MAATSGPGPYYLLPPANVQETDSEELKAKKLLRKERRVAAQEQARSKIIKEACGRSKVTYDLQKDAKALLAAEIDFAITNYVKTGVKEGSIRDYELRRVFDGENEDVLKEVSTLGQPAYEMKTKDDAFLQQVSKKSGGIPLDLKKALQDLQLQPVTLHEAAKRGNVDAIQSFVSEKSFPVDFEDKDGISPLGYAIAAGQLEAVKKLKSLGATAFSVDASGNSALHYAAAYGQQEVLEYLLESSANLSQRNAARETPLAVAQKNGQTAVAGILQSRGAK
mmetsp:Transcript_24434/g.56287  ORF Transcript_24434/g.56287 Transcript_24434/m.56287 type:complete len:279 (-) Transcript_24434:55-891(-)